MRQSAKRRDRGIPTLGRLALALGLACAAAGVQAQETVSVEDLKAGFDTLYKNEVVSITGWVATEKRVESATFKGFYLRDRFGALILVRTTRPLPSITAEILVTGVAIKDADTADVFISETARREAGAPPPKAVEPPAAARPAAPSVPASQPANRAPAAPAAAPAAAPTAATPAQTPAALGLSPTMIAVAGLGLLILGLIGFFLLRRPQAVASPTVAAPAAPGVATPVASPPGAPTVQEYKTVKVYKTTKVLPGRLVIQEGGRDGDVIFLSDQTGRGEVEIGRDSPDVTGGIRIKDKTNTMSRRQARITYSAGSGEFTLQNLAGDAANPTAVNGRQMGENESVELKNGDLLVMGSLQVKFQRS